MTDRLGLSALLSQVLVSFTVEFDNEFERRMPHRTTTSRAAGGAQGPWLVSLVMWSNFMRLVDDDGVRVRDIPEMARVTIESMHICLTGMARWGYVVVGPDLADDRPKPPRSDYVVHPTFFGRRAQEVWRPLVGVIEQRWQDRFGPDEIARLRDSLAAVASQLDLRLPEYLPILRYGLRTEVPKQDRLGHAGEASDVGGVGGVAAAPLPLPALLSQVLIAFALEYERDRHLSLAISADVVRLVGESGTRIRDLPRLAGVSKEAIAMSVGYLEKQGYAVTEPDPTESRARRVRLTPKGQRAHDAYRQRPAAIEARWQARYGNGEIGRLRRSLESVVGEPDDEASLLFHGLEPHPGGWRASVRPPDGLPHFPMVLHRGGFPDGA